MPFDEDEGDGDGENAAVGEAEGETARDTAHLFNKEVRNEAFPPPAHTWLTDGAAMCRLLQ